MEAFDQGHWDRLLKRIKDKRCTPFIGAGASRAYLPVSEEIAKAWAQESGYPLEDDTNLARVAQYLAVTEDPMWPNERICERFAAVPTPTLSAPDEPHNVLAVLDLPIYITTNYDWFMAQALRERGKVPKESVCLWNRELEAQLPAELELDPQFRPTPATPLVYHLHGHLAVPESLVLTEDDYLDFLIRIARDEDLLPGCVREAFTRASLLFVGYRIADWNFRVLFRSLVTYMEHALRRSHFSVQPLPRQDHMREEAKRRAQAYLVQYFEAQSIAVVYWGRSHEFAAELGRRWREAGGGG